MIDTHAHITKRFCKNIGKVIENANKNNINKIVLAASNIEESGENINLAKTYQSFLHASVGIHPQCTDPDNNLSVDEQINFLDKLIENNKNFIVAVGECGLDYSPAPPEEKDRSKKEQEILFRAQICLALKHKLPLIIHARKAVDETIEILKEYKDIRGVFHFYAGGKKRINKILDLQPPTASQSRRSGWYFGIDGNLTYEDGLSDVVGELPKNRLILETDSPFLTPIPHRGETNEPANVKYIYEKVAEIWKMDLKETEKIIDKNVFNLFKLV